MGKGSSNGGVVANRGFIFQAVVAEIQCFERDDWDAIKVEPETENDKVDIMLYKEGEILSAMQVKSSINPFSDKKVKEWLEKLRDDAEDAEEVCLYLVGDKFSQECETFIWKNRKEVKKVPFEQIQSICTGKLVGYIRNAGAGGEIRIDDLEFIDDALFAKLFKNSIAEGPVSRDAFEERFRKALPIHIIPKRLTPVPAVNYAVGLIGRDDIKKSIREMLEMNDCVVVVNGLGGIGKTAVMQHVCNDLKNNGKYVAWIECGGRLKEDLLLLRTGVGIPESDGADTAYKKILNEIKTNRQLAGNLYLFLDNLSNRLDEDEQGVLNGLGIHVMATSRLEHEYFENLPLDVLAEDSALDMFYGYYLEKQKDKTRRHVDAALDIVGSVQSHTLLIELLAKAAWKKGGTLESFRNELKEKGVFDVFKRKLSTKHDKNRTIEECVIKLYEISDLSPEQQHIMKLFMIFTPEKEIYHKIGEWADLDMEAMDDLVDLGWLERGGLENGYYIHQIIRDSVARQVGGGLKIEDYGDLLDRVIDTDDYIPRDIEYTQVRERLVLTEDVAGYLWPRMEELLESGKEKKLLTDSGTLFHNIAGVFRAQGDYERALEYCGKALAITEKVFGCEHLDTATMYNNIAVVYSTLGDYERAMEYYGKALAITEKVLGNEHPLTATMYNNMAVVYADQGEYERAQEYNGKALTIRECVLGREHPSTAMTYNNMAGVFQVLGEYERAQEYYRKTLTIRERVLGREHPDTATTYNNMADVFRVQGDYKRAQEYHGKALAIKEKVLGYEHPNTAATYNNMALVYTDQGEYERALEYYGKALTIRERVLGCEHPDTATTYNNMAVVYMYQGEYERAQEYYGKALTINERVLGREHPDTARTYSNMAGVFQVLGEYERAQEYYGKALIIRERVLGRKHPDTAATYNNMALVYTDQGDYKRAQEYYEKALTIRERVLGSEHPDTAATYNSMALVYTDQGEYERALEYYGKALAITEKVLGSEHPSTATTYNNMASVYTDQGEYERAQEYYGKALAIAEKVFGCEHPSMSTMYNNIAGVFRAQGEYERAQEYYEKALAIAEKVLGREHPDTAATYNNMALVYLNHGDYDRALEYFEKALSVFQLKLGMNHPNTQFAMKWIDAVKSQL